MQVHATTIMQWTLIKQNKIDSDINTFTKHGRVKLIKSDGTDIYISFYIHFTILLFLLYFWLK